MGLVLAGVEKHLADAGVACRAAMGFAWAAHGGLEWFGDFVVAEAAFHREGCRRCVFVVVVVVVVVGVVGGVVVVVVIAVVVWW